jgi:hypothetical protein
MNIIYCQRLKYKLSQILAILICYFPPLISLPSQSSNLQKEILWYSNRHNYDFFSYSYFVLLEVFTAVFFNAQGIVGYNTVPDGTGTEQEIPSAGT